MFATPPRQKSSKIARDEEATGPRKAYHMDLKDGPFRVSAATFGAGPIAMFLHG